MSACKSVSTYTAHSASLSAHTHIHYFQSAHAHTHTHVCVATFLEMSRSTKWKPPLTLTPRGSAGQGAKAEEPRSEGQSRRGRKTAVKKRLEKKSIEFELKYNMLRSDKPRNDDSEDCGDVCQEESSSDEDIRANTHSVCEQR